MIKYIKSLNWWTFVTVLLCCCLVALTRDDIPTISDALVFGSCFGIPVGLLFAIMDRD